MKNSVLAKKQEIKLTQKKWHKTCDMQRQRTEIVASSTMSSSRHSKIGLVFLRKAAKVKDEEKLVLAIDDKPVEQESAYLPTRLQRIKSCPD